MLPLVRSTSRTISTTKIPNGQWTSPIYASERVNHRKSFFIAHATTLSQPEDFPRFLQHLRACTKNPTHCMYAFNCAGVEKDHDGAEGGSGERLARLLRFGAAKDVGVVVFRWYGGVKIGPERWRIITLCAKEALDRGGFLIKKGK